MNHWELTFIHDMVNSLHIAYIPANLTIHKSPTIPALCTCWASAERVALTPSSSKKSLLNYTSWVRYLLCAPSVPQTLNTVYFHNLSCASSLYHATCSLRAGVTSSFWDSSVYHIAWHKQAFSKRLLKKKHEWTNKCYIPIQLAVLKAYWVDTAVHVYKREYKRIRT